MATIICPNCGHTIPAGSAFCPDCGFQVTVRNSMDQDSTSSSTDSAPLSRSRQQRRQVGSWQQRLIPNWQHLQQVGRFILANNWFLIVIYVATLVFNTWRWEILVIFLFTSYLFPLLSGRPTFFVKGPLAQVTVKSLGGPQPAEQVTETSRPDRPQLKNRPHRLQFMSNLEARVGTILMIPSLIVYLVARQIVTKTGGQTSQLFNRPSLGSTADIYLISLGVLGVGAAMVIGGFVKALTHHQLGGQRFKRWGVTAAILAVVSALGLYQNAGVTTSGAVSTIANFLLNYLPWAAVILYGIGIVKNIITPQRW